MEEICLERSPFKHDSLITGYIPGAYKYVEGSLEYSWFYKTPKYSTYRVNTLQTTAYHVVSQLEAEFNKLECYDKKPPEVFVHQKLPDCVVICSREVKNSSADQNTNSSQIIVDALCAAAVLRGSHVFAPGVLGISFDAKEGMNASIFADLSGKCTRGLVKPYNGEKLFIGTGIIRMNRHKLFNNNITCSGIAVEVISNISGVPSFNLDRSLGVLQNIASILCSHILEPKPGLRVLDMCAAPGNKTTHLAALMTNKGKLVALDKTSRKVERLKEECSLLGASMVEAYTCDSRQLPQSLCDEESNSMSYDRVLLDAPCSGLGRRPILKSSLSASQLASYPCLQKQLFSSGVKVLSEGGYLVYSTCTITVEENEAVVAWALERFPEIKLCKPHLYLGTPALPHPGLSEEQRHCLQRFGHPIGTSPETDTIGFFIAKFKKVSSNKCN